MAEFKESESSYQQEIAELQCKLAAADKLNQTLTAEIRIKVEKNENELSSKRKTYQRHLGLQHKIYHEQRSIAANQLTDYLRIKSEQIEARTKLEVDLQESLRIKTEIVGNKNGIASGGMS